MKTGARGNAAESSPETGEFIQEMTNITLVHADGIISTQGPVLKMMDHWIMLQKRILPIPHFYVRTHLS